MDLGCIYKLSVIGKYPALRETDHLLTIACNDGTVVVNFWVFQEFSKLLVEVFSSQFVDCHKCEKILLLSDFSVMSVSQLLELLTKGETWLHKVEERKAVVQLLIALGCKVITQLKLEVFPDGGQCPYCSR